MEDAEQTEQEAVIISGDFTLDQLEYTLPKELIAQRPAEPRDSSRLLVLNRRTGEMAHTVFRELPTLLARGDLLVINDTKVFPARLFAVRKSGGRVDVLLVRTDDGVTWRCLLDTPRKLKLGERLFLERDVSLEIVDRDEEKWVVKFDRNVTPLLEEIGAAPLPPYIQRKKPDSADLAKYQTVYAEHAGSIAAPTAGLHFTAELLDKITALGVRVARITLHVGIGTFRPVRSQTLREHVMESERYEIPRQAREEISAAVAENRRVIAVGTTCTRTLETFARGGEPAGFTNLFIYPPFEFKCVGALVTNFHLPKGTPLALVMTFAGRERILEAYGRAIEMKYRFFSYGDAMFIG